MTRYKGRWTSQTLTQSTISYVIYNYSGSKFLKPSYEEIQFQGETEWRKIPPRIYLKRQSSRTYSCTKHMGSSWGRTSEMNSLWAKLLVTSLDIKEDGCLKTGIRLNEDAIRPEQPRQLDRQSWWACPPPLALLCMTSKLQERTLKSVQRGRYRHKIKENYVNEGSPPELPALSNLKEA